MSVYCNSTGCEQPPSPTSNQSLFPFPEFWSQFTPANYNTILVVCLQRFLKECKHVTIECLNNSNWESISEHTHKNKWRCSWKEISNITCWERIKRTYVGRIIWIIQCIQLPCYLYFNPYLTITLIWILQQVEQDKNERCLGEGRVEGGRGRSWGMGVRRHYANMLPFGTVWYTSQPCHPK